VIVPYRAQVFLIRKLLVEQFGVASRLGDNVGTLDSFQGDERDLIVYGFTRSNQNGDIGFLKELRRLNVAMTRTKQQLVLVGDTSTLLHANNKDFAELMKSLDEHLREYGDIRRSREVEAELKRMAGSQS
jgi:superfamily I DNA and/or RNA helicase